jgi:hypothetical protein
MRRNCISASGTLRSLVRSASEAKKMDAQLVAVRAAAPVLDAGDLVYAEQLVLWATRRWLARRLDWWRVEEEYFFACGCARARRALDGLDRLLAILHAGARRTVHLHRLACRRISADEQALLTLIAAYQSGRTSQALALLEHLLPEAAARQARGPAAALATALGESGRILPLRAPALAEAAASRTIH